MTGNILSDNNCCEDLILTDVGTEIKRIFDIERTSTYLNKLNSLLQKSHKKSEELALLSHIGRYFIENGIFPRLDVVAKDLGIEPSRLNQMVSMLEEKGYPPLEKMSRGSPSKRMVCNRCF